MKRYFMEYDSDRKICGSCSHVWGFASSVKTAKGYISRCRKECAEYNPRNFRVYDTWGNIEDCGHVPCVYSEA